MTKTLIAGVSALGLLAATAAFAQPPAAAPAAPAAAPAAAQANCTPRPAATPAVAAGAPAAAPAAAPAGTATTNASACAKTKFDNNTSLKVLMNDEKAKGVLNNNIPAVVGFLEAAIDMLPDEFSVQVLHDMFGDMSGVDDAMLKKIGEELAKLS